MFYQISTKSTQNIELLIEADSMKEAIQDAMELLEGDAIPEESSNLKDWKETIPEYERFSCERVPVSDDEPDPNCLYDGMMGFGG